MLYAKENKMGWSNSASLNKGGPKALGHINKECKVHNILLIIQIKIHLSSLGTPQLIDHGPYLLCGHMLHDILLNLSTLLSSHIHLNLLNGVTLHKDGDHRKPNLLPYFLLLHLNHSYLTTTDISNLKCQPNLI